MIELKQLLFEYPNATFRLHIPELTIEPGEQVAIVGPSGCGKTTMLHVVAGILRPHEGTINVDGVNLGSLNDKDRRAFRISNIGLVFQEFELLDYLNVRDNILLPYRIHRGLLLTQEVRDRVEHLAKEVGISDKLDRNIRRLSQGERQRTAICRALLPQPKHLLADEPTGNLDPSNKLRMVELLGRQASACGSSLLMVTHDHSLLGGFDRVIDMNEWLESVDASGTHQGDSDQPMVIEKAHNDIEQT